MRIGLHSGSTLYPIAGQSGVSERTHSSAADFELTPEAAVQIAAFVRGGYAKPIDRGNLLNVLSFTTTRQFATVAEAQLWCLDYHAEFPSSGTLIFDLIAPNGTITQRSMADTVVNPPRRRVIGATALLDYTVQGGEIVVALSGLIVTGTLTSNGTTPVTFPNLLYTAISNGKASYSNNGLTSGASHVCYWDAPNSVWLLLSVSPYAVWTSSNNVATPDLVTTWTPGGTSTGTPVITPLTE